MLTLLISFVSMVGLWAGLHYGAQWGAWSVILALLLGIGIHIGSVLFIRKRIGALMTGIQTRITERNNVLMRKYQQMGNRGGNPKQLMDQARRDQEVIIAEALASTSRMESYCRWSPMLDRQINSLRVQFLYQLRRFDEVDKLLPKAMLSDPILCCMKMCRDYQRGDLAAVQKTYDKHRKKFKVEATLIYATYAWMLLKKKEVDKARQVLLDGKKATENEIIEKNWEHLTNDRASHFSNSGLGEPWYALQLEEPKVPKQRVQRSPGQFRRF